MRDKPMAVLGASPGCGSTARAQAQLREAAVFTGACVMPLPELLISSAVQHFNHEGDLVDTEIRAALVELIEALRKWTVRIHVDEAA